MGLLRSEAMKHGMLVLPVQDARRYIDKVGKETNIQFDDMNASHGYRRPFRKHVDRINEMERIIRFMVEELSRIEGCELTTQRVNEFLAADGSIKMDDVEGELARLYKQFSRFKENDANLQGERNKSVEEQQVVRAAIKMMGGGVSSPGGLEKPLLGDEDRKLGYLTGVVPQSDEVRFVRALWRASRGNAYTQLTPIQQSVFDPKTGQKVEKSVFVIFFQGAVGAMKDKVVKICQAFQVNMYTWPSSVNAAQRTDNQLARQLADNNLAIQACHDLVRAESSELVAPSPDNPKGNSKLEEWRLFCIKEKAIYTILNQCQEGMALRCEVWYPTADEKKIHALLKEGRSEHDSQGAFLTPDKMAAKSMAPTYIKTNEYTESFQQIINTYGIPGYQEANPALLTVVTFPFIFGMMYGDVGHGGLLLLVGI